jgi:hypothetical protein
MSEPAAGAAFGFLLDGLDWQLAGFLKVQIQLGFALYSRSRESLCGKIASASKFFEVQAPVPTAISAPGHAADSKGEEGTFELQLIFPYQPRNGNRPTVLIFGIVGNGKTRYQRAIWRYRS